jgi:hypothetical protein
MLRLRDVGNKTADGKPHRLVGLNIPGQPQLKDGKVALGQVLGSTREDRASPLMILDREALVLAGLAYYLWLPSSSREYTGR